MSKNNSTAGIDDANIMHALANSGIPNFDNLNLGNLE